MNIVLEKLTPVGENLIFRPGCEELNQLLFQGGSGELARFLAEPCLECHLRLVEDRLLLSGHLQCEVRLCCDRCLEPVLFQISEPVTLEFQLVDSQPLEAEELELQISDLEQLVVEDGRVDLRPLVLEQFSFHLPQQVLCQPDCAGICPFCGGNRNRKPCDCKPEPFNNRFGILKKLQSIDPASRVDLPEE